MLWITYSIHYYVLEKCLLMWERHWVYDIKQRRPGTKLYIEYAAMLLFIRSHSNMIHKTSSRMIVTLIFFIVLCVFFKNLKILFTFIITNISDPEYLAKQHGICWSKRKNDFVSTSFLQFFNHRILSKSKWSANLNLLLLRTLKSWP